MSYKLDGQKFHDNFMRIMKEKGLTQGEIAKRLGLSKGSVVSGQISPKNASTLSADRLVEYADILGVSIDELIGRQLPAADPGSTLPDTVQLCRLLADLWNSNLIQISPADMTEEIEYDDRSKGIVEIFKICFPAAYDFRIYQQANMCGLGYLYPPEESAFKKSVQNRDVNKFLQLLYSLQPVQDTGHLQEDMKENIIQGFLNEIRYRT